MYIIIPTQRKHLPNGLGQITDGTLVVNVVDSILPASASLETFSLWVNVLGPVGTAISVGIAAYQLGKLFHDWAQRGELKIAATTKAEDFVKSVWGTTEPNSPPQEESFSKYLEDCQINTAREMLHFLTRQMVENAKRDKYFARWVNEYGLLTIRQAESKLAAFIGYCIAPSPEPTPEPVPAPAPPPIISPPVLPPAIEPTTGAYIPLPQATASKAGLLALAAFAIFATFMMRR